MVGYPWIHPYRLSDHSWNHLCDPDSCNYFLTCDFERCASDIRNNLQRWWFEGFNRLLSYYGDLRSLQHLHRSMNQSAAERRRKRPIHRAWWSTPSVLCAILGASKKSGSQRRAQSRVFYEKTVKSCLVSNIVGDFWEGCQCFRALIFLPKDASFRALQNRIKFTLGTRNLAPKIGEKQWKIRPKNGVSPSIMDFSPQKVHIEVRAICGFCRASSALSLGVSWWWFWSSFCGQIIRRRRPTRKWHFVTGHIHGWKSGPG